MCIYSSPHNNDQFFQVSSCTIFEKKLLHDITHNIVFSASTFESRAEVYRPNKLNDQQELCSYKAYQRSKSREWSPNPLRIEVCMVCVGDSQYL